MEATQPLPGCGGVGFPLWFTPTSIKSAQDIRKSGRLATDSGEERNKSKPWIYSILGEIPKRASLVPQKTKL